jgi:hypothetical protein
MVDFKVLVFFLLLAWPSLLRAACHVATPAGTGSGADWTQPCGFYSGGTCDPTLASGTHSLVRGDSYYLAVGTYPFPSGQWQTATSGTSTITIKAVTDADNCTSTGYSHATFYGQALLGSPVVIVSNYWILNGQYGSGGCSTANIPGAASNALIALCPANSFGLGILGNVNGFDSDFGLGASGKHSANDLIENVEFIGFYATSPGSCEQPLTIGDSSDSGSTANTFINDYFHATTEGYVKVNVGGNTVTHSWFGPDKLGTNSSCHSEDFALANSITGGLVLSYNVVVNPVGTAVFATPSSTATTVDEWDIYGNQIILATPAPAGNAGNGLLENLSAFITKLNFINNSVVNFSAGASYPAMAYGQNTGLGQGVGTMVWQNNLQWNNPSVGPVCPNSNITTCTSTYNTYFTTTNTDTSTGVQGGSTSSSGNAGNPFTSSGGYNFTLAGVNDPTNPGVAQTLFTVDFAGKPYNVSAWSRGAFAFVGSVVLPPLNLSLTDD